MRYKIDHDYHIHSHLSLCSDDPLQTTGAILEYAKERKLSSICITDHYWDSAIEGASDWYKKQNFDHISESLPLPKADGIDFMFGCECDMDKNFTVGMPLSRFDDFDFVIIPTTHLHMTLALDKELRGDIDKKAELWVKRLDALLSMPLPFGKIGIAHLACSLIHNLSREGYIEVLNKIPQDDMDRLFSKAATLGCGIELNMSDMSFSEDEKDSVLRMFRTAKSCGCKFYLGSDAHSRAKLYKANDIFERAIDVLDLKESDKFHVSK